MITQKNIILALCVLFFVSLIFSTPLNNISIFLIGVLSFSRLQFRKKITLLYREPSFLIFAFYTFMSVMGLILTENLANGIKVLERNASFLLLPLFIIGNKDLISKDIFKSILNVFSCIIILISILSILNCYVITSGAINVEMFYRDNFLQFTKMQPMYFALYISLAGIYAWYSVIEYLGNKKWLLSIAMFVVVGFALMVNILLATRMTIIALIIALFIITIFKTKKIMLGVAFIIICGLCAFIVIKNSPILYDRYYEISATKFSPPLGIYYNSVNLRVAHWKCSLELSKENFWFGVGIGDVQDQLNVCYRSKNWSPILYENNYNCHCQYFQTLLGMGILGLISLITLLLYPIVISYKIKDFISIGFFVLIIISAFTESLFSSQKAIVFFSFFAALFVAFYENSKLSPQE